MSTLHPATWTPCTHQGHLDDLRLRQEDVGAHPQDRGAQQALQEAVGALLDHLDGKHAEDVRIRLLTPLSDLELK